MQRAIASSLGGSALTLPHRLSSTLRHRHRPHSRPLLAAAPPASLAAVSHISGHAARAASAYSRYASFMTDSQTSSRAGGSAAPTAADSAAPPLNASAASSSQHSGGSGTGGSSSSSPPPPPPPPPVYPPPTLLVRLLTTLSLVPILILFLDDVASVETVRGTSMQPTLNPHLHHWMGGSGVPAGGKRPTSMLGDDRVLLVKMAALAAQSPVPPTACGYARGQVVVLRSARDPRAHIIKRIIGVEGDWIRDREYGQEWVRVPRGRVWVEGDNAATSQDDSRQLGALPVGLICGRVTHIVWPPHRAGSLPVTLEPAGGAARVQPTSQLLYG